MPKQANLEHKHHRNPIEIKSTMMFLVANWNTTSSSSYTMDIPWKPEEPHPQFPHDQNFNL